MNFSSICRLCCEENVKLSHIYEENERWPVVQIFSETLQLEILESDGLPEKICKECIVSLQKIHETIQGYRENDALLRKQLQDLEIDGDEPDMEIEILEEEWNGNSHCNEITDTDIKFEDETVKSSFEYKDDSHSTIEHDDGYYDKEQNSEYKDIQLVLLKQEGVEQEDNQIDFVKQENDDSVTSLDSYSQPEHDEKITIEMNTSNNCSSIDHVSTENGESLFEEAKSFNSNKRSRQSRKNKKLTREGEKTKEGQKLNRKKLDIENPNRPRLNDFKCYICLSDSQGSADALLIHLNDHICELPYTCEICKMETVVINNVTSLNHHLKMHENPHKCPYCDRRYSNKRAISLHVQMHHQGLNTPCPSTCEYCGKVCSSKLALKYHIQIHTQPACCDICGKIFGQKSKLLLHIQRKHEKVKSNQCLICQKKLSSIAALQNHIKTIHTDVQFECKYCRRRYASELSLRAHVRRHETDPNFKSTKQWGKFYTIVDDDEGLKHGVRLKKCKLCGVVLKSIAVHMQSQHFPITFTCKVCGVSFKRKASYDVHILEHENGKAYKCPICSKEFSIKAHLIAHLKTKKHRDHPLAQSLDWIDETQNRIPRMEYSEGSNDNNIIEEYLLDEIDLDGDSE